MEASETDLDDAHENMSDEDFGVMADDLMFYRSTAYEFLEQQKLPVKRLTGRRPLEFVVNGAVRRYDFPDVTTLDVIVLYDSNREPRAIAPNNVDSAADYFGSGNQR